MKYKKSVYRNFALISQLGISVIVPIGLCIFIGVLIDKKFNSNFIIPLIFLGIAAGARNAYMIAMASVKEEKKDDNRKDGQE
ncbi:MAG: AtpZ/AtpI family protein [Butyrivibrio crossotus]|nr:AtpZ/AtpI family protein [Butyrivibrio crossotus]MDY4027992.1 AtpZ/AtpI family protein [Butyrivibrio crossotus]